MLQPLIIGHRGAPTYAKENTLDSFAKAIALRADMIEFDVRRTRDQVLIIHHDPDLNQQPIRRLTYADIQAIDPDIPTLEAAIALCQGQIRLDVELKEAGYEPEVMKLLLPSFAKDAFVITSFHPIAIKNIKQSYPDVTAGFLFGEITAGFCKSLRFNATAVGVRLREMQADFIAPDWELLDAELLSHVVTGELPIWVWTVNEAPVIERLLSDDRIAGIITDKPDLGMQIRQNLTGIMPNHPNLGVQVWKHREKCSVS